MPDRWVSLPPDIGEIFLKLDIAGALTWGLFSVILTIFVMAFLDTLGTLIALALKANLLDPKGNLPEIEKPMMVDACSTHRRVAAGDHNDGRLHRICNGIAAGGKSGLTAVVVAFMFLAALFFAPFFPQYRRLRTARRSSSSAQ